MLKKLIHCFTFYRNIFIVNLLVSLGALSIIYVYGVSPFIFVFWFKVAVLALVLYSHSVYRNNEFFYYLNLGLTKKQLWIFTAVADLLLFIALFILTLKIR